MTTKTVELKDQGFAGASCNELLRHVYVEWMNNYLTVELFAEHHEMTVKDAQVLLDLGRSAMKRNDREEVTA
tara:strand:- start:315 stop:530 length:216 start_codon:yes stop_codon:yes gene_type:complete